MCMHIGSSSEITITSADAPIDVLITLHAHQHRAGRRRPHLVAGAAQVPRPSRWPSREGGHRLDPYFLERIDYNYQKHH